MAQIPVCTGMTTKGLAKSTNGKDISYSKIKEDAEIQVARR
jgi:hypothetical protein